jgi:hypothetical protein
MNKILETSQLRLITGGLRRIGDLQLDPANSSAGAEETNDNVVCGSTRTRVVVAIIVIVAANASDGGSNCDLRSKKGE